ncbi:hypothetical protein P5P81_03395 [Tritonibacter mobilis]|nr:hypothetical protein [Tritonibacter mobilis]
MEAVLGIERGLGGGVAGPASTLGAQSGSDRTLCVRPNTPAASKARDKATVVSQKDADPMLREPGFLNESFDVGKKLAHTKHITRYRVQVNTRYNVRAEYAPACYKMCMKEDWHTRLEEVIRKDARSLRKISEDAKCGPNFVQQLLKDKKDPRASQLARLLETLGPGADFYVITGFRLSRADLEFLKLVSALDDGARQNVVSLMERLSSTEPASPHSTSEEREPDLTD